MSSLVISEARPEDTGKYKCSSEAGESAVATIHVITGEFVYCLSLLFTGFVDKQINKKTNINL